MPRQQRTKADESKNGTDATVLRKLGINEAYQLAMYLIDQYRGTILSCQYVVPSHLTPADSQTRLEEAVRAAAVNTVLKHPMMQVGIMDATSKKPSWIQIQSLDLTQHIKWLSVGEHDDLEQKVDETFRVQLDDHFPDFSMKQPGWKITVIRKGSAPTIEVLLTWNHPHFDGMGAKVFHEDFLVMLNRAGDGVHNVVGLDGDILRLPQAPPLLPAPIESVRSLSVDLKYLVKVFWEETRPQFLNRDVSHAFWCPIRSSPYKTQYRAFSVDNESLLTILALCRQNKTTITGLLNGLALIAFSLHLDRKAAPAFQSSTMVDHRRNMPPAPPDAPWARPDRAMGNYVTQLAHTFDTAQVARIRSKLPADARDGRDLPAELQRELWATSAHNRRQIVGKLQAGLRNDLVGLFKWVSDWQQTMRGVAKRARQFSWIVTNLGVIDGGASAELGNGTARAPNSGADDDDDDGNQRWSISRAQFGLSAEIPAAAIEFSPVSVAGRGMCVGATWPDCAVDVALGERIMADMERWLVQLARRP